MKRLGSTLMKLGRFARLALIASTLSLVAASNSHAGCGTMHTLSPTTCGVVISVTGCYTFAPPVTLTATSNAGDCIEITAPNVYLNLTDVSLKGTGGSSTGNGIHVTSGGTGATIVGGSISDFNIGILADARVVLEAPTTETNNTDGIQLDSAAASRIVGGTSNSNGANGVTITSSNTYLIVNFTANDNFGSGIEVNTSSSGDITDATTNNNTLSGITLNSSSVTNISGLNANSNGTYGVELFKSNSNKVFGTAINLNGVYGVYVKESSSNSIASPSGGEVHCNGTIDVYLGCSDRSGPTGVACPTASSLNEMDNLTVFGTGVNPYGIVIDLGNTGNKVLGSNGATDTIDDMYDENKAGQNTWFGNTFTTANQSYIH
jgi:hypothetical protein